MNYKKSTIAIATMNTFEAQLNRQREQLVREQKAEEDAAKQEEVRKASVIAMLRAEKAATAAADERAKAAARAIKEAERVIKEARQRKGEADEALAKMLAEKRAKEAQERAKAAEERAKALEAEAARLTKAAKDAEAARDAMKAKRERDAKAKADLAQSLCERRNRIREGSGSLAKRFHKYAFAITLAISQEYDKLPRPYDGETLDEKIVRYEAEIAMYNRVRLSVIPTMNFY
jgi:chromosome segregation ATPase